MPSLTQIVIEPMLTRQLFNFKAPPPSLRGFCPRKRWPCGGPSACVLPCKLHFGPCCETPVPPEAGCVTLSWTGFTNRTHPPEYRDSSSFIVKTFLLLVPSCDGTNALQICGELGKIRVSPFLYRFNGTNGVTRFLSGTSPFGTSPSGCSCLSSRVAARRYEI